MKRKIFSIICYSFTLLLLLSLLPGQAFAARKVLSVPQQQGSINCGASCASMTTAFFKGDTLNREQTAWNNRVSYNNNCLVHSGSLAWWNCTSFYSVRALSGQQGGNYWHAGNFTFSTLISLIDKGTPAIIGLYAYDSPDGNAINVGHAIVAKGYDSGSSGTSDFCIYNDPYDGLGHSATITWIEANWDTSGYAYWK